MLRNILIVAVAIGAASSSVRIFGLPSFSFQTVHNPSHLHSGSFFFGGSGASRFHHAHQQHQNVREGIAQADMIPVMVPVPQDFQGDSIVVTPDQLANIKFKTINAADIVAKAELINIENITQIEQVPDTLPIDSEAIQVDGLDIEPSLLASEIVNSSVNSTVAVNKLSINIMDLEDALDFTLNASKVAPALDGPLSVTEEVAVLIDSNSVSTVATPVSITEELTTISESPTTSKPITQPIIKSTQTKPKQAVAYHGSQSYIAHREFLNTWLRLASVNLNRPDLLTLLQPVASTPQPSIVPVNNQISTTDMKIPASTTGEINTTSTTTPAPSTEKINTPTLQDTSAIDDKLESILISKPASIDSDSIAKAITSTKSFSRQNHIQVENIKQDKTNNVATNEDQLIDAIVDEILMNEGFIDLTTLTPELSDDHLFVTEEELNPLEELSVNTESEVEPTEEPINSDVPEINISQSTVDETKQILEVVQDNVTEQSVKALTPLEELPANTEPKVEGTEEPIMNSDVTEISFSQSKIDETKPIFEVVQDNVTEQSDSIPQEVETISNDNLPLEKEANILVSTSTIIKPPVILEAVPWVSSRGRSGFRYSFAHRPLKGTFFLNSI